MKKIFKSYLICWIILFLVFNVICFVLPKEFAGYEKFGGAFWVGYIFITVAFIGQIICAWFAFKASNLQKLFYNIPLIRISYIGLILMFVLGGLVMAIPDLPNWIGVIVCLLILAFNAIAVIKASAAAEIVSNVDDKVKAQTQFVKMATMKAQSIMNSAKSEDVKAECRKVYEALRYADPVSSDALSVEEAKITVKLDEFAKAVDVEDGNISVIAEEIARLIKERNNKCREMKN